MTDKDTQNLIEKFVDGASRRDVLKTGALATAGLTVAGTGTAAAQIDEEEGVGVDDDVFVNDEQWNYVMFQNDYRPESEFVITSPVIDWTPNVPANLGSPFQGYNTRMIRYRGPGTTSCSSTPRTPKSPSSTKNWATSPTATRSSPRTRPPAPGVLAVIERDVPRGNHPARHRELQPGRGGLRGQRPRRGGLRLRQRGRLAVLNGGMR